MFLILSLDGGGLKGALSARILMRLAGLEPKLLERINLFAGTSTGAILACALAKGLAPEEIVKLYRARASRIFADRGIMDKLTPDELVRANYDNAGLKEVLTETFGTLTLGDLPKRVLVSAFDLDNQGAGGVPRSWKPKFLHNFDSPGNDRATLVVDAIMRSTAAPLYFPSYQGFIDGGVAANNPSMCALAKALRAGKHALEVALLSIGTGANPTFIDGAKHDWGVKQWLSGAKLLQVLFDGQLGVPDYQCQQILGSRYFRLNPVLPEEIALDAVERIEDLLTFADRTDLRALLAWIGAGKFNA